MRGIHISEADRLQIQNLNITEEQIQAQIETFQRSSFYLHLEKPCTLADGISSILPTEAGRYLELHEEAVRKGRFAKFVPASGAATRMFQSFFQMYHLPRFPERSELVRRANCGDASAAELLKFVEGVRSFAFAGDLERAMEKDGDGLDCVLRECEFRTLLEYLLTDRGLNYGFLPKALLKFHRYPYECRTAFEEHLVEAALYAGCEGQVCRIHFTVSPEYEDKFRRLADSVRRKYEERYSVTYELTFSHQKRCTDTIAVDMDNRPFRDADGRLLFRPGGHGALLENLNDLKGDLVYIKNIDNLIHEGLKETVILWKKVLGGYAIELQNEVHEHLRQLSDGASRTAVQAAADFSRHRLSIHFPEAYQEWSWELRREFLRKKLDRPIRVCGVVENVGEPGGAPFWVRSRQGDLSVQIVEKAQVDLGSPEQKNIWTSSTHFNPVDLVCAVRDYLGKPFDLRRYVDQEAVFISEKSKDGRKLKALELPGLWNGSMADWITLIVSVPRITFNPVKTVCDLLRDEHTQPS